MSDPSLTDHYEYANEHDIKCLVILTESGLPQTGSVKVVLLLIFFEINFSIYLYAKLVDIGDYLGETKYFMHDAFSLSWVKLLYSFTSNSSNLFNVFVIGHVSIVLIVH